MYVLFDVFGWMKAVEHMPSFRILAIWIGIF